MHKNGWKFCLSATHTTVTWAATPLQHMVGMPTQQRQYKHSTSRWHMTLVLTMWTAQQRMTLGQVLDWILSLLTVPSWLMLLQQVCLISIKIILFYYSSNLIIFCLCMTLLCDRRWQEVGAEKLEECCKE